MRQFFNLKIRAEVGGNLGKHIDGSSRPKTALPRPGLEPIVHLGDDGAPTGSEAAERRLEYARLHITKCRYVGQHTRGRKADPVGSFMIAGMPQYTDHDNWRPLFEHCGVEHVLERDSMAYRRLQGAVSMRFFGDALKHIRTCAGRGSVVAQCVVHQDELSPHCHIQLVMADDRGRLGWNRIKATFTPDPARAYTRQELMSKVQDHFHAQVAEQWGLERGEKTGAAGATRRREPIDREKGLQLRVEEETAAL